MKEPPAGSVTSNAGLERSTVLVEWVAIERVHLNPANPLQNDPAVPHVAASLRRFGWRQPIVAKPSGEIVAGNTRLKAAMSLGLKDVPVVWFEGSDLDALAYSIADNRTHEFASWDEPVLAKLLEELRAEDSLEGVGYTSEDLDRLIAELEDFTPSDTDDPGPGAPPAEPVTRAGDLWLLGEHRLLAGDSTKGEDLARLMAGEEAALLSTDPPYCVDYTGMDRPVHDGKRSGKDWSHLYREVDIKDLGDFLDQVFAAVLPRLKAAAPLYVWHAHMQQPVIARAFERHGLLLHQVLVWVKPRATFGHSFYRWRHEPCAFGWRRGHKPTHGDGMLESVWDVDWEGKAAIVGNEHPTQKPVRLFEIPMEQHTRPGDVVLEPFSGSGSQLIAAEKLRRRCRALEVVPAFVDVALRRWEKAAGKEAVLEGTGRSFQEVARERGNATNEEGA
jgi:DNA modification methylase